VGGFSDVKTARAARMREEYLMAIVVDVVFVFMVVGYAAAVVVC
jgi:hypothetical protein